MKNFLTKYAIILASTILLISAAWSCRTASRSVVKEKVSIDSSFYQKKEIEVKNDSAYFTLNEKTTINELVSLFYNLNLKYNGSANDSAEITLTQTTPNEIKLKIKGKASADFESSANQTKSTQNEVKKDSSIILQTKKEVAENSTHLKNEKKLTNKQSTVKSKSVPFWIYLFGFFLLVLIVALYWFFGRPKK